MKRYNAILIRSICIALAVILTAVFIPAAPYTAYAETIKITPGDLEALADDLSSYKAEIDNLVNQYALLEENYPGNYEYEEYVEQANSLIDRINANSDQIEQTLDSLIAAGVDLTSYKESFVNWKQDFIDEKRSIVECWESESPKLDEAIVTVNTLVDEYYKASDTPPDISQLEGGSGTNTGISYTPGKSITMSKAQNKFKLDATWIFAKGYDDDDTMVLSIKKDNSLWDLSRNKKIATKVKDMAAVPNDNYENGILVLKTNGRLYYMWRKTSNSWGAYRLLTGVKEFANEKIFNLYAEKGKNVDRLGFNAYVVKTNGNFLKGTIETNFKGTKVKKNNWTKLLGGVSHGYVVHGYDSDYNDTVDYFALKTTGKLYAWGFNANGTAGTGNRKKVKSPHLVMKNVAKFTWSNRPNHGGATCYAIKTNGDLYGWGDGSTISGININFGVKEVFKPTKLLTNVYTVIGNDHNSNCLALTKDGVLFTWGKIAGDFGEWENGKWIAHYLDYDGMTKVATNVIAADTNGDDIFFVKKDHTFWYMGDAVGSYKKSIKKPKKIATKVNAVKSVLYQGTFIIKTDGSLYGIDYTYKKGHKKLTKLGTGFPK